MLRASICQTSVHTHTHKFLFSSKACLTLYTTQEDKHCESVILLGGSEGEKPSDLRMDDADGCSIVEGGKCTLFFMLLIIYIY